VRGWETSLPLLFAEQHQQLRIRCEDLAQSVLEASSGFDALADIVDPLFGNALDASFPGGHERQEPDGVALAGSAVTGGFAATAVSQRDAAWQQILGQGELAKQGELALAPASGIGTFGGGFHLNVIMHSETMKIKSFFERENRTGFLSPTSSKLRVQFSKA
jgi:hypothetical protein